MNPAYLIAASAFIIGFLGCIHLVLTYRGPKLRPRDPALEEAMTNVAPVITTQTDFWSMWIGFNASHSLGAILFGLVYSYLALTQADLLFESLFLQGVGWAMVAAFTLLAKKYWFITPFIGSAASLLLYSLGVVLAAA